MDNVFCTKCGTPLAPGAAFCSSCGARNISKPQYQPPQPQYGYTQPQYGYKPRKRLSSLVLAGIIAANVIVIAVLLIVLLGRGGEDAGAMAQVHPFTSDTYEISAIPTVGSTSNELETPVFSENPQISSEDIISEETNTAEHKIREALASNGSVTFRVSSDFLSNNAQGVRTSGSNGSLTDSYNLDTAIAEEELSYFLVNQIIRIENGKVSIDNSNYQCQMSASDDGISIRITEGDYSSVNQGDMNGIISGNTLSGNIEISSLTVANGQSNGYTATGSFQVSLIEIESGHVPPKPPINLQSTRNSDDSITLTWEDPNPSGTVVSFEIVCCYGTMGDYATVATVQNTEWTDNSGLAKTIQYDVISYYIIAHGADGTESELSKFLSVYIMS